MRITRMIFLFSLISLFMPCLTNAQTVRYVAFFPIPYITHTKVEVDTAYFAGRDDGRLKVGGSLSVPTINASKDLVFSSTTSTAAGAVNLSAGAFDVAETEYGDFLVLGEDKKITFTAFTSGSDATQTDQLKADDSMELKAINWGSNIAFKKGTSSPSNDFSKMNAQNAASTGAPSDTVRFCWSPLRIKGTFEYQYYLIAYDGDTCP